MCRIKCRKCGAESYAAGDTGLVCIRCFDQQAKQSAKRIEELEIKVYQLLKIIGLMEHCILPKRRTELAVQARND